MAARIAGASTAAPTRNPRAGHGRERHRRQEFRVVLDPVLRIRIRPGEIEHELAARMSLAIQRQCAHQPAAGVVRDQMLRRPSGPRRGAAGFLEREQEFMPQERLTLAAGECVPLGRVDLGDAPQESRPARASRVSGAGLEMLLGVETLQILVGVERGHAAGARRGDRLTVDMVGDIAGREHAGRCWWRSHRRRCRP